MVKDEKEINKSLGILAKSAVVVLIGIILSKIFSYAYRVMIARIYGPEIYGIFLIALGVIGILIQISLIGFDSGIVRYIPLYKSKDKKKNIRYIINFGLITTIILSITLGFLLFFISDLISIKIFHEPGLIMFLKIFSILIPIIAVSNYLLAILNGYEKISWFSFIENIWKSGSNVLFLILLYLFSIGSSAVPLSYLFAGISTLILSYIIVHKYIPSIPNIKQNRLKYKEKIDVRNDFIKFSFPLLFFYVISVLMGWIDSFSIGYFKSATEVGIYNAAVPIALLLYMAPQLFTKLFLPMISREYGNKKTEVIKQLTQQIGKWILLINLPLFLILFIFPENFIDLLFGSEFISASIALRILLLNTLFLSIGRVSNRLLVMAGRTKIVLVDILIAVATNLILNMIFIPMPKILWIDNSSGINGAALATTIASILIGVLFIFQANKSLSIIPFRRKMINLFLAGAISAGITYFISSFVKINLAYLIVISLFLFLFYFALVLVFKGLDRNDLLIIKKLRNKIHSPTKSI